MAATSGVPARAVQYATLVLVALAVVVALKAIGIVLVNAMLIVPVATASLIVRRLTLIIWLGAAFGLLASVVGLYVSYYANVAASAAIVLVAGAQFLVALAVTSWSGRRPAVGALERGT